jgi:hypothetical protein
MQHISCLLSICIALISYLEGAYTKIITGQRIAVHKLGESVSNLKLVLDGNKVIVLGAVKNRESNLPGGQPTGVEFVYIPLLSRGIGSAAKKSLIDRINNITYGVTGNLSVESLRFRRVGESIDNVIQVSTYRIKPLSPVTNTRRIARSLVIGNISLLYGINVILPCHDLILP